MYTLDNNSYEMPIASTQRAQNTPKPQAAGVATDAPGSKAQSAPLLMTAPIKLPAEAPAASLSPKITVQSATGIPNLPPPARASQIPAEIGRASCRERV